MESKEFISDIQHPRVNTSDPGAEYEEGMFSTPWSKTITGLHNEDLNAKRLAFHAGPCWIKILVADRVAGSIIGKAGKVITEIEHSTGCIMKLSPGTSRLFACCLPS